MTNSATSLLPIEVIQSKIYVIRGHKVLLDRHLAKLYGVSTGRLNEQVMRNKKRFPEDFMFELTKSETEFLVSQNAIPSKRSLGGYLPKAFTEQGVAMLSSVLKSEKAIAVNIQIMRVFTSLRLLLSSHAELRKKIEEIERKYDARLKGVDHRVQSVFEAFEEIKRLLNPPEGKKKKIGFV